MWRSQGVGRRGRGEVEERRGRTTGEGGGGGERWSTVIGCGGCGRGRGGCEGFVGGGGGGVEVPGVRPLSRTGVVVGEGADVVVAGSLVRARTTKVRDSIER